MNFFSRQIFKEPLFQFLIIGLVLLGGERLINSEDYGEEQYSIFIDNQILAQFMQRQAKSFKPEDALKTIQGLTYSERQRLIESYVQGEVLYREALALNLERDDQIIRRRLIQKMDYWKLIDPMASRWMLDRAETKSWLLTIPSTQKESFLKIGLVSIGMEL